MTRWPNHSKTTVTQPKQTDDLWVCEDSPVGLWNVEDWPTFLVRTHEFQFDITCLPISKSLSSVVAKILKGNPKFWGAPLAKGHALFSSGCNLMMGFGKPKLYTKFEVASFSRCKKILKGTPKFWGASLTLDHSWLLLRRYDMLLWIAAACAVQQRCRSQCINCLRCENISHVWQMDRATTASCLTLYEITSTIMYQTVDQPTQQVCNI